MQPNNRSSDGDEVTPTADCEYFAPVLPNSSENAGSFTNPFDTTEDNAT